MRLVCGLRFRHLRPAFLAIFAVFLLWKWEKGSLYTPGILRPEPLVLNRNISMEEDLPIIDPLVQSVTEVGKEATSAPPPLTIVHNSEDVINNAGTTPRQKKECDYRNGKWFPNNHRPLYSGPRCKRWLSESWNCRLTQRTDFAYEKFRWHPEGCGMPAFQTAQFLRRMQDKTIAYVGDSLGRQMFQSMMCMLAASGKHDSDVEDVGSKYEMAQTHRAKRPTRPVGSAYRFRSTNTTVLYYWSSTLCDLEPLRRSNPSAGYAMHLDRPPSFLKKNLHRLHVLVLNTGHHWNRGKLKANKWEMYASGAPNNNREIASMWKAKNFTIHGVMKWLDAQLPRYPRLKVFYRSLSPRHFFNGEWNTGGTCDNKDPLAKGTRVFQNHSEDADGEGAVKGTRIKLLDITALSRLRDEGHISKYSIRATPGVQDCLHWCLPGVPDTWNEILAAQL
ncbi:protein trichome birefringence-like 16 [Triticum dicoccoides]|uniref:protein trichome birefringence-like 16 n=1 Tax=Triticum dicoccoides TaxID=85692 RepID=UPI001890332B|nr:protein trichome birefringence-like 16 [Triticum dicoccoides]XP_037439831.1 protein trichome birefringence-like 16 [Triticum dicoccoides]